jgi:hypothetical protein
MLVSALGEGLAAYLERHADAEAGCWWSGRDRAGAGHHLWCGHSGSSAPRVNERRVNKQEGAGAGLGGGVPRVSQAPPGGPRLGLCVGGGVHFNVRLEDERLCMLVLIGAGGRAEGVDRGRRRLPRECGELEVGVAGSEAARYAGAGFGSGRCGGRCGRCVVCDARTMRWVPQDAQMLDSCQACKAMRSPDHASPTTALDNISNLCKADYLGGRRSRSTRPAQ